MNDSRQALGISPEQGPPPTENSSPANRPTRLAIRIWTPTRLTSRWSSDGPLIYLITDLICAGSGSPVETSDSVLIAQFEHSGQAYRTAKRLQWALFEFCQRRPDECLGAAAILYDAMDPASRQEGPRQLSTLLQRTRPAQILATTTVSDQLQEMPGLQLRSLTSMQVSRGEWQGGAQEVLWTKASSLEQIQERLKEIARAAIQNQELTAREEPAPQRAMPVFEQPTVDFSNAGGYRAAPTIVSEERPSAPIESAPPEPIPDLLEPDDEGSGSRTLWLSLAAVVAVAVLALLLLPRLRNKQAVTNAPAPLPVSQQPVSQQEAPTSKPEPVVSAPEQEPVATPSPKPVGEPKPPIRHAQPELPTTRSQPKKLAEYGGMSEKDIPMLLRMAEKEAGAGNYEDARRKFDTVLHLDPSNTEAKMGLKKLDLSERESR
jgi:hypothetical protein